MKPHRRINQRENGKRPLAPPRRKRKWVFEGFSFDPVLAHPAVSKEELAAEVARWEARGLRIGWFYKPADSITTGVSPARQGAWYRL